MKHVNIFFFKYLIISLLLSFLPVLAQEEAIPNPTVVRLINEAIELHNKKDYLGAIETFEEALSIESNNTVVRQNLSIVHNNFGKYLSERTDYEKALKEFRIAIYYDPSNKIADSNLDALLNERGVKQNDPQVRSQIGDKLRADANFEAALVEYQKALGLSKTLDPNLLISIGDIFYILYLREGQKTNHIYKALDSYKKALEVKESAKAHIKVGDALLALKDVVSAIDHYKKSAQLEPTSQDALTSNIRGWNEAVRLAPLVAENHIGLAQALQLKKDFTSAEEHYNQALKLDPENPIALQGLESLKKDKLNAKVSQYFEKALKLQAEGEYADAINEYIKALEINPKDTKLHYNIGTAFQAKEDFEHAQKAYKQSIELDPTYEKSKTALELLTKQINLKRVRELTIRAVELQNTGNYQEAITTYLAAISLDPASPSLYYNLGTAYQASNDLNNAQVQYQKAQDLDKNNQIYLDAIKLVKSEIVKPLIQSAINKQTSSDNSGAIEEYLKVLAIIPEDAQTHFNLATAYQAKGDINLAIQSYVKAVELDPQGQVDALFFIGAMHEESKNNKAAIENYQKYLKNAPSGSYSKDAKERMDYLKTLKQ